MFQGETKNINFSVFYYYFLCNIPSRQVLFKFLFSISYMGFSNTMEWMVSNSIHPLEFYQHKGIT